MLYFLAIGLGGSMGALSRYLLSKYISNLCPPNFPWAVWIINLTGSFALGLYIGFNTEAIIEPTLDAMITLGFLSSYTTFSTFIYDGLKLLQQREEKKALLYVFSSLILGLLAAFGGLAIAGG